MLKKFIITSLSVFALAYILPGVEIKSFWTALITALVLGLLNLLLKPILLLFSLPVNIITFGLFTFFINAFIMMIVGYLVPGLSILNFWWAFIFSLIISVINFLFKDIG